ncbi:MAG: terminase family protein [Cypionkella sp.]|nr:terminase family protein [Cypionkella sp.]
MSDEEQGALLYNWRGFLARPNQLPPEGEWDTWLAMAGRGFGKTEMGAQWVRERIEAGARQIALVAETQKDLEEVMVARLLDIYPASQRPKVRYKPVRITWPNGAIAYGYNGTEPDQLRGPEFDTAWVDELAKYRYATALWDMLKFTMRGTALNPKVLVTTTPRAIDLIKDMVGGKRGNVSVTRGKTEDNRANLAPQYIKDVIEQYAGRRLGRQELYAEILGDLPGALWSLSSIDAYRLREAPPLGRIVVSVDPAVTATDESDEHGIVVAGMTPDKRGVVLEDASMRGTPAEWARRAVSLYQSWQADGIVVEVNQGGDMVAHTLRSVNPNVQIIEVRASRGKHVRAEPIAALYEQGRVVHVGSFPELESQMTQMTQSGYDGTGSPDRLDALVWAMTTLFPDMVSPIVPPPAPIPMRRAIGANRKW